MLAVGEQGLLIVGRSFRLPYRGHWWGRGRCSDVLSPWVYRARPMVFFPL
jgi:hypothetical protein